MNIKIIEKPENISWNEITKVIHNAYKERERQNLHFAATKSTPEENAQKIIDGKCFLAVKEKYKHQGIGRKLLQKLIDECKLLKLESVMIDTSSKLKWLNRFYSDCGFKKVDYISWNTTNYYTIVRKLNLASKKDNNIYRIVKYYSSKIYTILTINKYGKKRIEFSKK